MGGPVLSVWRFRLALKNLLFYLVWKNGRGARSWPPHPPSALDEDLVWSYAVRVLITSTAHGRLELSVWRLPIMRQLWSQKRLPRWGREMLLISLAQCPRVRAITQ